MTRRRTVAVIALVMVLLALPVATAYILVQADATARGTTTTIVVGAMTSQPGFIPTGHGDLQTCSGFTSQAFATLNGGFDGVWHEVAMTASCDTSHLPDAMPVKNSGTGTLDVIYARDHSRGSFNWKGTWTADLVTGELRGVFDATSSSGDPTFGCSSLHVTFDAYFPPTTVPIGGYRAKWVHVCPK